VSRTDHFTHVAVDVLEPVAITLWHTGAGTDTARLLCDDEGELFVVAALDVAIATSAPAPTSAANAAAAMRPRRADVRDKLWGSRERPTSNLMTPLLRNVNG
jgi:hypothetical protein